MQLTNPFLRNVKNRDIGETEEMPQVNNTTTFSIELHENSKEPQSQLGSPPNEETPKKKAKEVPFSRIWYGLKKADFGKAILGSSAAAVSGISKPMFGFFIMTIGVAYYRDDARRRVGRYSVMFCAVGLLTLITHILQHYLYGIVGERAMRNLREALFSGITSHTCFVSTDFGRSTFNSQHQHISAAINILGNSK